MRPVCTGAKQCNSELAADCCRTALSPPLFQGKPALGKAGVAGVTGARLAPAPGNPFAQRNQLRLTSLLPGVEGPTGPTAATYDESVCLSAADATADLGSPRCPSLGILVAHPCRQGQLAQYHLALLTQSLHWGPELDEGEATVLSSPDPSFQKYTPWVSTGFTSLLSLGGRYLGGFSSRSPPLKGASSRKQPTLEVRGKVHRFHRH